MARYKIIGISAELVDWQYRTLNWIPPYGYYQTGVLSMAVVYLCIDSARPERPFCLVRQDDANVLPFQFGYYGVEMLDPDLTGIDTNARLLGRGSTTGPLGSTPVPGEQLLPHNDGISAVAAVVSRWCVGYDEKRINYIGWLDTLTGVSTGNHWGYATAHNYPGSASPWGKFGNGSGELLYFVTERAVAQGWISQSTTPNATVCKPACNLNIKTVRTESFAGKHYLSVEATSFYGSIEYSLDGLNWQATPNFEVNEDGQYRVRVRDANSCTAYYDIALGTVNDGTSGAGKYSSRWWFQFKDWNDTRTYRADIQELGYTGASTEVRCADSPVVLVRGKSGDDPHKVVVPTECKLLMDCVTSLQFEDLFTSENEKYKLVVSRDPQGLPYPALNNRFFVNDLVGWTASAGVSWNSSGFGSAYFAPYTGSGSASRLVQFLTVAAGRYRVRMKWKNLGTARMRLMASGVVNFLLLNLDGEPDEVVTFDGYVDIPAANSLFFLGSNGTFGGMYLYYVELLPADDIIFTGFVGLEQYSEPYNTPPYVVQASFYDGLAQLKEKPFRTSSGTKLQGFRTVLDVVRTCLYLTGLDLEIQADARMYETRMPYEPDATALELAYVNLASFYDDKNEPKNAYEVLETVLAPLGVQLFQEWGVWQLKDFDSKIARQVRYSYGGEKLRGFAGYLAITETVAVTVPTASPRYAWVGGNMQLVLRPAYSKVLLERTTGLIKTLNVNPKFELESTTPGYVLEGWFDSSGQLSIGTDTANERKVANMPTEGPFVSEEVQLTTGATAGRLKIKIVSTLPSGTEMRYRLKVGPYYLAANGTWTTTPTTIANAQTVNKDATYELTTNSLPTAGLLQLSLYGPCIYREASVSYESSSVRADSVEKLEYPNGEGKYTYEPSPVKLAMGDNGGMQSVAYLFRNSYYLAADGTQNTRSWAYRKSLNASFAELAETIESGRGWAQTDVTGTTYSEWSQQTQLDGALIYMLFDGLSAGQTSKALYVQMYNTAGDINVKIVGWTGKQGTNTLANTRLYVGWLDDSLALQASVNTGVVDGRQTWTVTLPNVGANAKLAVWIDGYCDMADIYHVEVSTDEQEQKTGRVQDLLALRLLAMYQRPKKVINGTLLLGADPLLYRQEVADSHLPGLRFKQTAQSWDLARAEVNVELIELTDYDDMQEPLQDETYAALLDEQLNILLEE